MITTKQKRNGIYAAMLGLGLAVAGQSASAQSANCEYVVSNEWGSGATATVRITNNGGTAVNGWDVNWSYDDNQVTNSWNAQVSGSNPYTATDLGWNGTIQPGQTVEFGMQVEANGGVIERPTLSGDVCTGGTSSSSSS